MMKSKNDNLKYLGFDDRMVLIVGIPVLAVIVPVAFFRENFITNPALSFWSEFWHSLIFTSTLWFIIRFVMIAIRKKYYGFKHTARRAILQVIALLIVGFVVKIILGFIFTNFFDINLHYSPLEAFISIYFTSLFVLANYEGLYLYYQNKQNILAREQLKREQIHSELQGLRSQVNPHFLFNSMNTLLHIIEEDQALASSFLKKLSRVYRYILEKRDDHLIPLKEELAFIESYIFLQKERFKHNLEVELEVDDYYLDKLIVPLSLQMVFENAIKHNIISSKKPLKIEVYIDPLQYLVIKNNLQLKKQTMPSTGVGLQNIKSRFEFFSSQKVIVEQNLTHFIVRLPLLNTHHKIEIK